MHGLTEVEMRKRLVRYAELRPCTTAFVDARTPGSDRKENFTIIGRGVAENPEQFVHIDVPHGFNVGGARQPPRCLNSQHSHETAEVFIVQSGRWRFKTGETGHDGFVDLGEGDTISIPTRVFRGFENIGDTTGFMFAVLGGDDPGRVTWAPYVFDSARAHGLVLLESGRLIDTNNEPVPPGARLMAPTTSTDVEKMRRCNSAELTRCTVRLNDLLPRPGHALAVGIEEYPIIGGASSQEGLPAGQLHWPHGFAVRALKVSAGSRLLTHCRLEEEVLLMHRGKLRFEWPDGALLLEAGDTLTVPKRLPRAISNPDAGDAVAFVVRGGDVPRPIEWANSMA